MGWVLDVLIGTAITVGLAWAIWPVLALKAVNDVVLPIGRGIAVVALALMVAVILAQIFYRYVLNDALTWPDEAARFMMLWMTGLIAPMAYRRGGFVAIDMLEGALPARLAAVLTTVLLVLSLLVLVALVQIAWSEVTGFAGRFTTASLMTPIKLTIGLPEFFWLWYIPIPVSLPDFAAEAGWFKMPRSQMMASLLVGLVLLILVSAELILRQVATLIGRGDRLPTLPVTDLPEAE